MKSNSMKRKLSVLILSVLMVFMSVPITALAAEDVTSSEDEVILINSADELVDSLMTKDSNLKTKYKLASDIDMSTTTKTIKAIGLSGNGSFGKAPFTGVLDGDGHTISNLSLTDAALFNEIGEGGEVKNLTIESAEGKYGNGDNPAILVAINKGTIDKCAIVDSNISSTRPAVGFLVSFNDATGKITNSAVTGSSIKVESKFGLKNVGGFAGRNKGTIDQCYSRTDIVAKENTGGFIGVVEAGKVSNSYSIGTVTGTDDIGGFAGGVQNPGVIENCYTSTDVKGNTGQAFVGGSGSKWSGYGTITNSYFDNTKEAPASATKPNDSAIGKSAEEMNAPEFVETLAGGQEDVWKAASGRTPILVNAVLDKTAPVEPAEPEVKKITVHFALAKLDKKNLSYSKDKAFDVELDEEGATVLALMEKLNDEDKVKVNFVDSTYGKYIDEIDGIKNEGWDGWSDIVNDQKLDVGISAQTLGEEDTVLFYYSKEYSGLNAPTWDEVVNPSADAVEIASKKDLIKLSGDSNPEKLGKNYILTADIDLKGADFEPIGSLEKPFSGKFDGNGHKISNLTIKKDSKSKGQGLFAAIENAQIRNVNLEKINIEGGSVIGGLAGKAQVAIVEVKDENNKTTYVSHNNIITNCTVDGKIKATGEEFIKSTNVGGLVGTSEGKMDKFYNSANTGIFNSKANVEVIADQEKKDKSLSGHIGGLVGFNNGGKIINCEANGNVTGGNTVGGLVGTNMGTIEGSKATGNVKGVFTVGGLIGGDVTESSTTNSIATGNVAPYGDQQAENIGGFAGWVHGKYDECAAIGVVTPGWSWNGGFAGKLEGAISGPEDSITVKNCIGNTIDNKGFELKAYGNYLRPKEDEAGKALMAAADKLGGTEAEAVAFANEHFGTNIDNTLNIEKDKKAKELDEYAKTLEQNYWKSEALKQAKANVYLSTDVKVADLAVKNGKIAIKHAKKPEDNDNGSGSDETPGTEPGAGSDETPGTEPGTGSDENPGTEPGTGSNENPGIEPGTGSNENPGTEPGASDDSREDNGSSTGTPNDFGSTGRTNESPTEGLSTCDGRLPIAKTNNELTFANVTGDILKNIKINDEDKYSLVKYFDVNLKAGFIIGKGGVRVDFNVGKEHNGKMAHIKHYNADGTKVIDSSDVIVKDGKASIVVKSLSPFSVAIDKDVTAPKTGDNNMAYLYAFACLFAAATLIAIARKKVNK